MAKRALVLALMAATLFSVAAQSMPDVSSENISTVAKIPAKAEAEKQIVKEGQIWRYHSVVNTYMEPSDDIYLDLCFSGSTEIDGQEYLNCYTWKTDDVFSEETAALIGYMREDESGKVYVRYIADSYETALEKGIDILPYAPMMSILRNDLEALSKVDILLYDPSLEPGDELHSSTDKYLSDNFIVTNMSDIECLGINRHVWRLSRDENPGSDGYNFYEGVGDIYGLLPMPSPVPDEYGRDVWKLEKLIDQSGNVLFSPSLMTSSVDRTAVSEKVVKETFHNINGMEVSRPTGKGVYIKTETLGNGNVRTSKVMVQ